jgi:peptidoglycan/LPS O-acetylase OafA/YrhL
LTVQDHQYGRLRELDGWRALSAMLVVVHHVGWYQHPRLAQRIPVVGHLLYYCGALGVKVFFVISGFVICRLLMSEELRWGGVSLKRFYYRRALRILPPLFTYLAVVCILLRVGVIKETWKGILNAALFLNDFNAGPHSWFVGHSWSLSVEEQFYLLFPTIFILTSKGLRGRVFVMAFFLCGFWYLTMCFAGWNAFVYDDTRVGFACIAFGVIMAIYEVRARALARNISVVAWFALGILLLHPAGEHTFGAAVYEALIVPPAIGLVLLSSMQGSMLRGVLCSRPVQAIGLTSYGLYLWQQLFTAPWYYFVGSASQTILRWSPSLLVIVPVSYYLIERPAMRCSKSLRLMAVARTPGCDEAVCAPQMRA